MKDTWLQRYRAVACKLKRQSSYNFHYLGQSNERRKKKLRLKKKKKTEMKIKGRRH